MHHFAGELFKLQTGADILHVPYKGSGPATADAVSGQVQVTYASVASVLRFVQAGRLRALAVTSKKRSSQMPEVPSMVEAGLADFELTSWYGLLAPAGTPRRSDREDPCRRGGGAGRRGDAEELRRAGPRSGRRLAAGASASSSAPKR